MRIRLWGMALAVLVAASGSATGARAQTGGSGLAIDGRIGVSAAIALVDGHLQSVAHALQVLAMTEEVGTARWDTIRPLLATFKEVQLPAVVFFALPDGSYHTVEKGKIDQNIKDRAYFSRVMAGATAIGDLVVSRSTGRKVTIVAVPVKRAGKVIGLLGVAIHLDALSERLSRELQLPSNMVVYAIDGTQGTIALHSVTRLIFDDRATQENKALRAAVQEMRAQEEGTVTYEVGERKTTAVFKTSSLTGWRFALAVSSGPIE
jgi:hypothetical protein